MRLSKIYSELKTGVLKRDADFQVFDKMNNLSWKQSIVFITQSNYLSKLNNSLITGIICTKEIYSQLNRDDSLGIWIHDNPKDLFYQIHEFLVNSNFYLKPYANEISNEAIISPRATIADHSVKIGKGSVIEDNVVIKPFTKIGNNSMIRSSSDIGSDGFEVSRVNGKPKVIKHAGEVIIGDNVEIQSLTTISRGLFPTRSTVIYDNVKIADMVHVAHGVVIGDGTMIAAGVTISGNTNIGSNVLIGPGAILSNRINIGDNADISIGSVVVRNVNENEKVTGNLAINHKKYLNFIIKNEFI